jgi:hypothetical protein
MPITIPVHFAQQYTTNVEMLLRQEGGKLRSCVTQGSYTGKGAKFIEQFGPITPSRDLPRQSDTPLTNPSDDARWIQPHDLDAGVLIDSQDKVRMLIDPTSGYTTSMVEGMRLAEDDEILNAFFAPAFTGENGTTVTNFPASSQDVLTATGGANSGMNVAKLRAAKKLFIASGINLARDKLFCLLDSRRHDELLNEIQVVNLDYNTKPVLVDGLVTAFMGFNFILCEWKSALDYPLVNASGNMVSGTDDLIPAWAQSGMHIGDWKNLDVDIGPRRDKRNAPQIYATKTIGASRTQEKKIVRIRCYNS